MRSDDASSIARLGSKRAELRPGETVVRNAEDGRRDASSSKGPCGGRSDQNPKGMGTGEQCHLHEVREKKVCIREC